MLISISTSIFPSEVNPTYLLAYLQKIKSAGFDYVELGRKHTNISPRIEEIESTGVTVWAVHGDLPRNALSSDNSLRLKAVEEELKRMEDTAVYAPCPYVIHYLDRVLDPRPGRQFRKSVEQLHEKAKELGFILSLETAPYKPQVNERYPDSEEIANFVRSFESPNMRVTVDINHSNLKEDLIQVAANCRGIVGNIHISDNMGKWEDHLPPGEGTINIRGVLLALIKCGYAGPCNVECHHPHPTIPVLKQIKMNTEKICKDL